MWLAVAGVLLLCTAGVVHAEQRPFEYAGYLDGGGRLPCIKYFVLHSEASECVNLPSPVEGVTGELCQTVAGPMLAIYSPESARNVFIARVTGPQVVMLPLSACTITTRDELSERPAADVCDASQPVHRSAWYGLMSGMVPGNYTLDVTMLYTGFSYGIGKLKVNNETLRAMTANVIVSLPDKESAESAASLLPGYETCTYCIERKATWPTCNASDVGGTWLTELEPGLLTMPQQLATVHDNSMMHWQPKGCHFVPITGIDWESCLADKHICFVGDSQTRHMFNGFVDAVNNCNAWERLMTNTNDKNDNDKKCLATRLAGNWTDKGIYHNEHATYRLMTFGDGWVHSRLDVCTHVIFNFGQWPLSPKPPSRWSASHWAATLHDMLASITAYRARHPSTRFYWADINSHTIGPKHMDCNDTTLDYRMQPFLEQFNTIASAMMDLHGVAKVNTGLLTSHLTDLTYDGSHYHWAGTVGHYITEYISNVVCVQS